MKDKIIQTNNLKNIYQTPLRQIKYRNRRVPMNLFKKRRIKKMQNTLKIRKMHLRARLRLRDLGGNLVSRTPQIKKWKKKLWCSQRFKLFCDDFALGPTYASGNHGKCNRKQYNSTFGDLSPWKEHLRLDLSRFDQKNILKKMRLKNNLHLQPKGCKKFDLDAENLDNLKSIDHDFTRNMDDLNKNVANGEANSKIYTKKIQFDFKNPFDFIHI